MLISFLAAAATTAPRATPIDIGSWFGADTYPMEALRKGIEGTVGFEVDVDADGRPVACRVTTSSGQEILDQATCDVVRAKARFKPARGRGGKAVPGTYSNRAAWRLDSTPAQFHRALILDFTGEPTCTVESDSATALPPTCEQMLEEARTQRAAESLTKMVFLMAMSPGGEKPYQGKPEWGERLRFVAMDQYVKGMQPIACTIVAAEGQGAKPVPLTCPGSKDVSAISEQDKKDATKLRVETSVFAVRRKIVTSAAICDTGESSAEQETCN